MNSAPQAFTNPSPGHCIYCGATGVQLTSEHIIPRGLHGTYVILEASCDDCRKMTSKIETDVLDRMLGLYREKNGFPSYKKRRKEARRFRPTVTDSAGKHATADLPASEYPSFYIAPQMPPPGVLVGREPSMSNPEMNVTLVGDAAALESLLQRSGMTGIEIATDFPWGSFCRMLAKVAHGFAVTSRVPNFEPFLPAVILGNNSHLAHYVGGARPNSRSMAPGEVQVSLEDFSNENIVTVLFRLPRFQTMPAFEVVAGRMT